MTLADQPAREDLYGPRCWMMCFPSDDPAWQNSSLLTAHGIATNHTNRHEWLHQHSSPGSVTCVVKCRPS